ncbi:Ribosomal large subunit pseudouridine synthase D [hydrothermal vent metagenome]|uniref:Ribosomal large subunit pseudouridine synthase D n=1 Tax=hydrothermal vent metagenome TaxID=652676 RepID=A0A3B0YSH5_9ZZZZ
MSDTIYLSDIIPEQAAGRRLDQVLAELFPQYSRSRLQQWTKQGKVLLDGKSATVRQRVLGGETVEVRAELQEEGVVEPQAIALDIVYQDEQVLVINKPAGLVVHPAVGNRSGTLQNGLLYLYPDLATVPRAGIVHRLDKDTSGLMVVARTLVAHTSLVGQLQAHSVSREYLALVHTVLTAGGTVDAPIGRHPKDRLRMAVVESGRPAISHYRVLERFAAHTLVQVRLETGRTHQIRVHMAHIHCPLVGDPVYGGRPRIPRGASEQLREALHGFRRQALHARRLAFLHPGSGERVSWEAEPPEDFSTLLDVVRTA